MLPVMNVDLPDIMRRWRVSANLTQGQAADLVGVSQATLSRLESGRQFPDRATARAFVEAGVFTAEQLGLAAVARPASDADAAAA